MVRRLYLLGLAAVSISSLTTAADVSAYPLFEYEKTPLTEKSLGQLIDKTGASTLASLSAFDEGGKPHSDAGRKGSCKVFPGDKEWPSQRTWKTFNKLLGGALIETMPIAAPCYQNSGVYDAEKCAAVRNSFTKPYLHESDPTSIFWPQFQGRTCLPTDDPGNGSCTHGGYPVYAVNVSDVAQIQLAVNFARNANQRLVIKNTGHCYLGKSSGAGALSIWTHNLKSLKFYPNLKMPGYTGPAMKVGAGVTVREVYAEAHRNDVSALGGICESVGYAGGYIAGGGHTPLSGLYGMAADHVLALEVVTADGRFITASPEHNTDLYWALRGAGGGTFGVVTSFVIRVHPKLPVITSEFTVRTSPTVTPDTFWEAMRAFFALFIPFTDAGTYSWWTLISDGAGTHTFSMEPFFAPNHTLSSFATLTTPFFSRLRELNIPVSPSRRSYDAFYPAYNATWGRNTVLNSAGGVFVPGNRLLPRGNWEDPAKFNATFAVLRRHSEQGRMLMGYHQAPRNRANADNAVSSAWREAIAFLILSGTLPAGVADPTPAQMRAASEELQREDYWPVEEGCAGE